MGGPGKGQGYEGGGEFRVRGNAHQILERYLQLARDAGVAGDRVAAENYLQHADHYYRVLTAIHDGQRPRIGGREVSVADVNVQNVSQGLSAALSTNSGQVNTGPGPIGGERNEQGAIASPDARPGQSSDGNQDFNRAHMQGQPRAQGGGDGMHQRQHFSGTRPPPESSPVVDPDRPADQAQSAQAPSHATGDEQPDYPEELLPQAPAQQEAEASPPQSDEDGDRPMRSRLRGKLRAPHRRSREPGDDGSETEGVET